MPGKANQQKLPNNQPDTRSILIPSRMIVPTKAEEGEVAEGFQEVEIAAQVTLPIDGGWAWVVMVCSTVSLAIIDGIVFTFGPLLPDICKDLGVPESKGTFITSTALGMYFLMSPVASALINRFSFRTVGMAGSLLMSTGIFGSYMSGHLSSLIFFYGILNGIGLSFASLSVSIVCGFYFEKLRSIALATVSSGTSIGTMILYPVHDMFVRTCGWRYTFLFQSGLSGLVYFMSLSFKPLISLTVTTVEEEGSPTRTVTLLPTVVNEQGTSPDSKGPQAEQRKLKAVSNAYFPTAATIIDTQNASPANAYGVGTSTGPPTAGRKAVSRLNLKANTAATKDQIRKIQSMVLSRRNLQDQRIEAQEVKTPLDIKTPLEIIVDVQEKPAEKTTCCARWCDWEPSPSEARPMYRDDAFYTGKIEDLPVYKETVDKVDEKDRMGLEYQMAVTRAVTVDDLDEKKGVLTTAVVRVLASMFDPTLLKITSFVMYCVAGFLLYFGAMIPYVYTQARALHNGVDNAQASLLVSVLSLANLVGRGIAALLVAKLDSLTLWGFGGLIAGISTMLSSLSYSPAYQFGYALVFGFSMAPTSCLRSIVIVNLYGLENLTTGTGLSLLFIGVANMIGTPAMAALKDAFGFEIAFYCAGGFITAAGVMCLIPLKVQLKKEQQKKNS